MKENGSFILYIVFFFFFYSITGVFKNLRELKPIFSVFHNYYENNKTYMVLKVAENIPRSFSYAANSNFKEKQGLAFN